MMKIGYLIVLLLVGAYANNCDDNIVSPYNANIKAVIDYLGSSGSDSIFSITFNNPVPTEQYPNNPQKAAVDVHSFALVDPNTYAIKPAHMDFGTIFGGAYFAKNFTIPSNKTGNSKCLDIAFYYQTTDQKERYFYGSLSLSTSSKKRSELVVDMEIENNVAARAVCDPAQNIVFPGSNNAWSSNTAGTTVNTWFFNVTAVQQITNVKYDVSNPQITVTFNPNDASRGPFASLQNAAKSGSLTFVGCYAGADPFVMAVTVTYKCNNQPYTATMSRNLVCN